MSGLVDKMHPDCLEPIALSCLPLTRLMRQVSVVMEAEPFEAQEVKRDTLGMQATIPDKHTGAAFSRPIYNPCCTLLTFRVGTPYSERQNKTNPKRSHIQHMAKD